MMKPKPNLPLPPSTQSGFTIIESLVAVILVTILLSAIAPVIALSVATRVQARRVEQATDAARTFIDGVRSGKIAPPNDRVVFNTPDAFRLNRPRFANETPPPPSSQLNCQQLTLLANDNPYCTNSPTLSLYCADLDNDNTCTSNSSKDLIVQAFRSAISFNPTQDNGSEGYLLGVRVYKASSFDGSIQLQRMADTGVTKAATYAGGGGDRTSPLVETTTEIRGSSTSYESFEDRLGIKDSTGGGAIP